MPLIYPLQAVSLQPVSLLVFFLVEKRLTVLIISNVTIFNVVSDKLI